MIAYILELSPVVDIFISIGIVLLLGALVYFLAISYFKERQRLKDEKALTIEGILTKTEMLSLISSYITRATGDMQFSLMYIELDKFDDYENAFGTLESERIIERIVRNIESAISRNIKIARMQKDELILALPYEYDRTETMEISTKVKNAIAKQIRLFGDTTINASASIAIAFFPAHGSNVKELLNSLQIASYIIKKNGGNAVRIYSEEMSSEEGEHVEYYYQIKHAIQHKEFQLFYHPIINVQTNTIYGAEALIRWNHPEHGLLSPFKFLGIMEQSGDIHWIGLWGLETIIKTYQEISQMFPTIDLKITMNLSPKQLMSETLFQDFQKILKKYRMNAKHIVLEIVEFTLFDRQDVIRQNLNLLKQLGFLIAIDGFGLDFQTLEKVAALNVDIIKLDSGFLSEEEDFIRTKFANLIVDFAKKHHCEVICELIETQDLMIAAKAYDIHLLQGYYFSQPISAEALRGYIGVSAWDQKL